MGEETGEVQKLVVQVFKATVGWVGFLAGKFKSVCHLAGHVSTIQFML